MIGVLVLAAQLSIVAHAPDSAAICDAIEVSVAVSAPGSVAPRLIIPSFAPFDVLRSSPVPHVTYEARNGGSVLAEYRYVLTTDRTGTFALSPFEARVGSSIVRSRPMQIVVQGNRATRPIVIARARVDTSLDAGFRSAAQPETVYVGQQANYEVAVFLNETVRDRLRRNPTFFPPDMQSMLAYDLPTRGEPPRRQVSSHCFDALVYQRALFPLMPGRFAIPPAQLVYSLPLSASFFSREETHELQTDSSVIVAVEPPAGGRPSDFGGAVGNLHIAAKLDTVRSRVGDPTTLTVRVSGTGNVKLFPRPSVGVPWATLVNADERVQVDTTARKISGSKEFDWVLTPKIAGELDLPPIRYPYFNPDTRRYEIASTSAAHLRVGAGSLANADTARAEPVLSLRTRYRGAPSAPLHEHPVFWALLALAPLPAFSMRTRDRRRGAAQRVRPAADRLSALVLAASDRDACEVRRLYTMALANRLSLDPEAFTRPGAMARALRRRGVSTDVALRAERFLRELDEAAFSASGTLPPDAATRAKALYRTIDDEALGRAQIVAPVAWVLIGILTLGVATAGAADVLTARHAFDDGVAAYEHHDFQLARDRFALAAASDPAAADAWANLGTASWAIADTAHSVAGWQRALRLEPTASDVRARVELAHALPLSAAGYVPPLPASWVFDAAALLWLITWATATYRAARGRATSGYDVAIVGACAAAIVIAGFALNERLSGRRLAVVRHTISMNTDPELGGERGPTAIIGEVVRVGGRQGAWTRVVLDDGRDGWVENAELLSLDARDAAQIAGQ